jgi:cold shock CspA family protein
VRGRVDAFDEHRGDGLIRTDEGASFYFHCVSIADGTRSVTVGETVSARRGVGRLGHDEAVEIEKVVDA